jgi:hypothetical protein
MLAASTGPELLSAFSATNRGTGSPSAEPKWPLDDTAEDSRDE